MPAFRAKPPKGSILNRADPLAKGLVAAWQFNEGSGLTAYDSANKNNGTLTSGVSWGSGRHGKAPAFNGSSGTITLGASAALQPASLTVAFLTRRDASWNAGTGSFFWCKPNATFNGLGWYFEPYSGSAGTNSCSFVNDGYTGSDAHVAIPPDTLFPLGIWRHVTLTFTPGGAVAIYIDGVPQTVSGSVPPAITGTTDTKYLGSNSPGYGAYLNGAMDAALIFNRVLPAADIRKLAADPFRLFRRRSVVLLKASSSPAGVTATAAITEAADTLSAAASVAVSATGAITESADTLTAAGAVAVAATATITEGADTLSASAVVASGVVASASITESPDTLTASGTVAVAATAALTEGADTLSASAVVLASGVLASSAITEAPDTLTASASVALLATAAITEGRDTLTASAVVAGAAVPGCVCATVAVANRVSFTLTVSNRVSFTLKTDCCSAA